MTGVPRVFLPLPVCEVPGQEFKSMSSRTKKPSRSTPAADKMDPWR